MKQKLSLAFWSFLFIFFSLLIVILWRSFVIWILWLLIVEPSFHLPSPEFNQILAFVLIVSVFMKRGWATKNKFLDTDVLTKDTLYDLFVPFVILLLGVLITIVTNLPYQPLERRLGTPRFVGVSDLWSANEYGVFYWFENS